MSKEPKITVGRRYRYRQRKASGIIYVAELVRKKNGWWVLGHDKKANRTVEVQPGQVFDMKTPEPTVLWGAPNKWPTK